MNEIKLIVLGDPKSQKRHRHVRMGKFTRQYDPSANDKGDFLSIVQNNAPLQPLTIPLSVHINFYFSRPKTHYKSGKNSDLLKDVVPDWHIGKPDADNCIKFVFDALNKIYWKDDSVIASLKVTKMYCTNPRTEITINALL